MREQERGYHEGGIPFLVLSNGLYKNKETIQNSK